MILTISTTHEPATDLGYLLHKHPDRTQSFDLAFGQAHVFYPEASPERCTVALLLDVDSVGLVRGPKSGATLFEYVSDRPYVASSFMSVAISRVLGTALAGNCRDRPELVETEIPLEARLAAVPSRGGEEIVRRLFEPLGYEVETVSHALDPEFPDWGESRYLTLTLRVETRLQDLLRHLYVLVPVLDNRKHYWVAEDEVDKLVSKGAGWLAAHPERGLIARRYLKHRRSLARMAVDRLVAQEELPEEDSDEFPETESADDDSGADGKDSDPRVSLHEQRLGAVLSVLRAERARRVVDLGCGEGRLLRLLLKDPQFEEILGMDVSIRSLEIAKERLHLDRMSEAKRKRIRLMHGSLMYRDERLSGFDAAAVVEVVEHLDPPRLAAFERVVFDHARPAVVVLTTPNREYNVRFETLPADSLRHRDHRFEWTRGEFASWAESVAERFGYAVRILPIGTEDPEVGAASQMGVFTRE
ncbi:MAG: 3' terminal RNA ribose 2'-O-methyltransferase Hen1 [marine benthic group bacterium]|jgi:3' terminal RNA ribose 2'-O-methyltransferase Hen1|nr:3' terminal RNA ribose 2'-O-methyltransferase Hen1 [Candidatus Carthagonibacter metallireducens]MCL7982930.1 3' terminal RNA ribose 2'-O-methyltransferase Hen1 [Gemmatimonadota bacterium]MCL7992149.1 3' terminal RNA ribose 2'-O-methyltransferase Hen1 [Gemmatimonadota bacterium]